MHPEDRDDLFRVPRYHRVVFLVTQVRIIGRSLLGSFDRLIDLFAGALGRTLGIDGLLGFFDRLIDRLAGALCRALVLARSESQHDGGEAC